MIRRQGESLGNRIGAQGSGLVRPFNPSACRAVLKGGGRRIYNNVRCRAVWPDDTLMNLEAGTPSTACRHAGRVA